MTRQQTPLSTDRRLTLWLGLLLLNAGHVVETPHGDPEIIVRTKEKARRIRLFVRDAPVSLDQGRTIIGKVADLEEDPPDVVVIVSDDAAADPDGVAVVPVRQTKASWLNEGRHYSVPTDKVFGLERLDTWLSKQGRPA